MQYTFTLDTDRVELGHFSSSLDKWFQVIRAVAKQVDSKHDASIVVESLYAGSTNVVVEIQPRLPEHEPLIASQMRSVNYGLQSGNLATVPSSIQRPARELLAEINRYPDVPAVIASGDEDFIIVRLTAEQQEQLSPQKLKDEAVGTITGRLQTLSTRKSNLFVVYDHIFDKAVRCQFPTEMHERVHELFDKQVHVHGMVTRYRSTGIPISIRDITAIEFAGSLPGDDYTRARGVLRGVFPSDRSIEELVREMRHG